MSKQFLGFDWFIGPICLTSAIQGLEMQHFIKPQGNGAYLCFFKPDHYALWHEEGSWSIEFCLRDCFIVKETAFWKSLTKQRYIFSISCNLIGRKQSLSVRLF